MNILNENMCTFIPRNSAREDLDILHLVYETKPQEFDGWKTVSFYRMHFVVEGKGVLHTQNGEYPLSEGDVFFCLPSTPYAIQSVENFKYVYIGYLGGRANATAHRFKINIRNCVFHGLQYMSELWKSSAAIPDELSDLHAEGLFSSTIAAIAAKSLQIEKVKRESRTVAVVKKYIDENFTDPELSLQNMCVALSYNAKYISRIFKQEFKLSFKEYLNTVRINNACALMNKSFCSIKVVAFLCGFNDPLYFSKVFKAKMGQSPSEYLTELKGQSPSESFSSTV